MNEIEEPLQYLLAQVENRERSARRRALIYTLVPILVGVIVLIYSGWRIQQDRLALEQMREEHKALQMDVEDMKQRLEITADQLDLTLNALEFAYIQVEESQQTLRRYENQLAEARQTLETLEAQSEGYRQQIEALQLQLADMNEALEQAEAALREATTFQRYEYQGDLDQAIKYVASFYPSQGELLIAILHGLGDADWAYRGTSPGDGFDSPGLAAYVLERCGLVEGTPTYIRGFLSEILPIVNEPQVGDLVRYQMGYHMFYFLDEGGQPFVAGMTPFGVLLFRYDFAQIERMYRIEYPTQITCDVDS